MFLNEYPTENLRSLWRDFAKTKNSYAPNTRWEEINDTSYRNCSFLSLTLDDALYNFYLNNYTEEDEKTLAPFYDMAWMVILAKKAIIDYGMEEVIYSNEFDTYFKITRLSGLLDRVRDLSEFKEEFSKYESKLLELFPKEEITLYDIFNNEEYTTLFDKLCDDEDFGIEFIDTFGNMLAYDFVRNYFHLNNERDLSDIYDYNYTVPADNIVECCDERDNNYPDVPACSGSK